jgi:hypothetical protein
MTTVLNSALLSEAFGLLSLLLERRQAPPVRLIVCGGSALIATGMIPRETTRDVDIVALLNEQEQLADPSPLPADLLAAAADVATALDLPANWLNNGPSSGDGGLYRLGLPAGFVTRLIRYDIPPRLVVYFIGRLDQIHFKLYATADRGGYHMADLLALQPTDDELIAAARWTMTHDVSNGYRAGLKETLQKLGYEHVAQHL